MQASIPSFIHSIKVSDLRQGDNSLRILSIRHLPACEDDDREATIDKDKETEEDIKWGHYVVSSRYTSFD
jgi:Ca2+-dependent lipid-binding protein